MSEQEFYIERTGNLRVYQPVRKPKVKAEADAKVIPFPEWQDWYVSEVKAA